MRVAVTAAFAAIATIVSAPSAQAQGTIDLSQATPQTVQIPGTVRGRGGAEPVNFNFELQNFVPGKNGAVCAAGVLSGGGVPPTEVLIPVETATRRTSAGDCTFGGTSGGGASLQGGFGSRDPGQLERPARSAATSAVAIRPAAFGQPFAKLIPAQVFPPPPPPGGCNILNLRLGPINLNLLGLVVQTNTIILNVIGLPQQGLLGNLLCALLGP